MPPPTPTTTPIFAGHCEEIRQCPPSFGREWPPRRRRQQLTPVEYNVLPRAYDGKRIFKAPDASIDRRMRALWLSALPNGKIYRIGAQFISEDEKLVGDAFASIWSHSRGHRW
jgi:hypothetical protein